MKGIASQQAGRVGQAERLLALADSARDGVHAALELAALCGRVAPVAGDGAPHAREVSSHALSLAGALRTHESGLRRAAGLLLEWGG